MLEPVSDRDLFKQMDEVTKQINESKDKLRDIETILQSRRLNLENIILEKKQLAKPSMPLHPMVHDKLLSLLQKFIILGGMPEVVETYISTRDFSECYRCLTPIRHSSASQLRCLSAIRLYQSPI